MGFNPNRKYVPRKADYWFVAAAVVAMIVLLVWAFAG